MLKRNQRLENPIYYGAKANTLGKAHDLRMNMTNPEKMLWQKLRNKKVLGFKFRRQHAIGQFVADFYCHEAKLIIEVDGGYHQTYDQKEYDENRTFELENLDIEVIRFKNEEVETEIEKVLNIIENKLIQTAPPISSPKGEDLLQLRMGLKNTKK